MKQCWFPPQSPATSTAAWQRVIKKKGSKRKSSYFTQLQQQQKWRKYAAQPKVTAPRVFEYEVDASPSSETIQIYENIHKCIRIKFYLSAITLSLSSKFFTPFDVSEDSDWHKCFILWRHDVTRFLCRRLGSLVIIFVQILCLCLVPGTWDGVTQIRLYCREAQFCFFVFATGAKYRPNMDWLFIHVYILV